MIYETDRDCFQAQKEVPLYLMLKKKGFQSPKVSCSCDLKRQSEGFIGKNTQ